MKERPDEFYARYRSFPEQFPHPTRVTVELTSRCNLSCPMCPRRFVSGRQVGDMEPALWKRVIDEVGSYRECTLVPFFRGEPLLHPRFLELLAYAREKGVAPIQLATNAALLTEEMARGILELGLEFVSFSIDAADGETYGKIRRGARYEEVVGNVERFLELRRAMRASTTTVQVSAVRTEQNEEGMERFIALWKGRVDRVRIYREHSREGRFGTLGEGGGGARRPCLKLLTDAVVYWDGSVGLCNHDWEGGGGLGDVGERPLAEIWRGEAYRRLRQRHLEDTIPAGTVCFDCDHWRAHSGEAQIVGELYE